MVSLRRTSLSDIYCSAVIAAHTVFFFIAAWTRSCKLVADSTILLDVLLFKSDAKRCIYLRYFSWIWQLIHLVLFVYFDGYDIAQHTHITSSHFTSSFRSQQICHTGVFLFKSDAKYQRVSIASMITLSLPSDLSRKAHWLKLFLCLH